MPRRILIAFDKFKESMTAPQACSIAADEVRNHHPDWHLDTCPLSDGGDGFAAILTTAAGGRLQSIPTCGPHMEPIEAAIGWIDFADLPPRTRAMLATDDRSPIRKIAVIEMAAASGLALVPVASRDPWRTTSFGTGRLIQAATDGDADLIVLGVGGSATVDVGLGMLEALGLSCRDATGTAISPTFPGRWTEVASIATTSLTRRTPIVVACDVTNPLLGPTGAATIFGPQKGLRVGDIPRFESQIERMAGLLCGACGADPVHSASEPGAGAAGGAGFALRAALGARMVPGFELIRAWLDLDARVRAADLIVTGEGRWDATSATGKGPGALVHAATTARRPHVVLAGSVAPDAPTGTMAYAITGPEMPLPEAFASGPENLRRAVARHLC